MYTPQLLCFSCTHLWRHIKVANTHITHPNCVYVKGNTPAAEESCPCITMTTHILGSSTRMSDAVRLFVWSYVNGVHETIRMTLFACVSLELQLSSTTLVCSRSWWIGRSFIFLRFFASDTYCAPALYRTCKLSVITQIFSLLKTYGLRFHAET
jgi:hypothetical protein